MSFGLPGGISIGGSLFTSHSHALMDDWDLLFNLIEYFFEERERRRERERTCGFFVDARRHPYGFSDHRNGEGNGFCGIVEETQDFR